MKIAVFLAIIAFLLGIAIFGIYKSLELVTENAALGHSFSAANDELASTRSALNASRSALGEAYLKNAKLEDRAGLMEEKLTKQEDDIKTYGQKLESMSKRLRETASENATLFAKNKQINDQLFRTKLEVEELRGRLSSVAELKIALKEAKIKQRQQKRTKRAVPVLAKVDRVEVVESDNEVDHGPDGNAGFLTKNGKSTFQDLVDIQVLAVESEQVR